MRQLQFHLYERKAHLNQARIRKSHFAKKLQNANTIVGKDKVGSKEDWDFAVFHKHDSARLGENR